MSCLYSSVMQWPILRLKLLPFGHPLARIIVHAQAQAQAFASQSSSFCLGPGLCSSCFCLLAMHRRIQLPILRFELMLGHGHEPAHELNFEMTKTQKYDYKYEFQPEHRPELLPDLKLKARARGLAEI